MENSIPIMILLQVVLIALNAVFACVGSLWNSWWEIWKTMSRKSGNMKDLN